MACLDMPQVPCPVQHHFGPGIYVREVHIPAGTFSIGHHQKTEHLNLLLKGRVIMINLDGSTYELVAPVLYTSSPGRKMGYIKEDMVWLNIYATSETDVNLLEQTYIDKSDSWKEVNLSQVYRTADREDFKTAIAELGFTEEEVRKQSENPNDQVPFSFGTVPVQVALSKIQGQGLFATADFKAGDIIVSARVNGFRTPAGRFTNHALYPNAVMEKMPNGDIILVACKDIHGYQGGQLGEEITIDYRQAYAVNKGV